MEPHARLQVVGHGLLGVLLPVKVLDPVAGVVVLTELRLVFFLVELGVLGELDRLVLLALDDVDLVDGVRQVFQGTARLDGDGLLGGQSRLGLVVKDSRGRHDEDEKG